MKFLLSRQSTLENMKPIFLIIAYYSILVPLIGQGADDWTWYDLPYLEGTVRCLEEAPDGDIWIGSGKKVIKYDGVNWLAYDLADIVPPDGSAYPYDIDASLGNTLWLTTRDRVVELDHINSQWTVHDPTNGQVNVNARKIKVLSQDNVLWGKVHGLMEYNGSSWFYHGFQSNGLDINPNGISTIQVDGDSQIWLATSSSSCIECCCFTPAGLIKLTETDTMLIEASSLGFSEAWNTDIIINSVGEPIQIVSVEGYKHHFYMTYSNDQWSVPVEVPFQEYLSGVDVNNKDEIYFLFEHFIAVRKDNEWDVIPLDTSKYEYLATFMITNENGLYIGGRSPDTGNIQHGVLGYLPYLNYRIRGKMYSDNNYNGTFDSGDQPLVNHFVRTVAQERISFTNTEGNYSLLFLEPGTYSIEGILPDYFSYGNPVDGIFTRSLDASGPASNGNDIGFYPDTTVTDLSLSMTSLNGANPGFQVCIMINVKNLAPKATAGMLSLSHDDILTLESADPVPQSINGNIINFDIAELAYQEIASLKLCFLLPPESDLIGDTLVFDGTLHPISGTDLDQTNNIDQLLIEITGPFDPNYIEVFPRGAGITGDIPITTSTLEYTIHFQNIGTDTARNIIINNPIDVNLDIFALNVTGSSHAFDLSYIQEGSILQWSFHNINLPDSVVNELSSNGFVKYTIGIANHEIGTTFENKADIYFDFNPPIATNIAQNTLTDETTTSVSHQLFPKCEFLIQSYKGVIGIKFPVNQKSLINIYNLHGTLVYSSISHENSVDIPLNTLYPGCYVVSVISAGCVESEKFIIY
jgi:uncharacterized repeat protein (TIGR01451 family)